MAKTRKRIRLPELLLTRGLANDLKLAEKLILAGLVRVDGSCIDKIGTQVSVDAEIEISSLDKYVSRGGEKLEAALEHFKIDIRGMVAIDIGSSTGGFTDCMLQRGVKKVYAVDVGTNQLDWKIRKDPRVLVLEQTNARYVENLTGKNLSPPPQFATVDVSFISATEIVEALTTLLPESAGCLVLVKPHFELEREEVDQGGVVTSEESRLKACAKVSAAFASRGWRISEPFKSPLRGNRGGNVEYFLYCERGNF